MISDRIQLIKTKLDDSRDYLNAVLDQVNDRWETQVYSDGLGWTVRQLVIHLADTSRGLNLQVMNIAEGKDIIPADFDIERYNRRTTEKNVNKTVEQAREELAATRQQLDEWLSALDPEKLDRQGRHPSLEIMTVEQLLGAHAAHERGHARDIARTLNIEV